MTSTVVEIAILLVLIIANGVFAMAEAAMISARKARLQQRANEGDARARVALGLAEAPNVFLATIQIGITLIGILAGAFGGATLAKPLADLLATVEFLAPQSEAIALAVIVLIITYLSLIIGELVPKQLALNNPERIASAVAGPMSRLARIASPLVRLLDGSTRLVLRLLGVRPSQEPSVTEEEIKVMIEAGTQAGEFEEAERELVNRIFRLADMRVEAILTPRTEVTWLDVSDTPDEIRHKLKESGRSRFPVAQDSLDNVLGIVQTKDLLNRLLSGEPFDLRVAVQRPLFVPGSVSALKLLQAFKGANMEMALVLDEYGGLQGLVTITDVLEKIVGGGYLVEETAEPRAIRRADGSWLLDGLMPISEVKDVLALREALPGEDEGDYQTLGGFVMSQIGRIPISSDNFEAVGMRFEVVDMDGHRVDKVLVSPLPPPAESPAPDSDTRPSAV